MRTNTGGTEMRLLNISRLFIGQARAGYPPHSVHGLSGTALLKGPKPPQKQLKKNPFFPAYDFFLCSDAAISSADKALAIGIPGVELPKTPRMDFWGEAGPYPSRSDIIGLECTLQVADEDNIADTPDDAEGDLQTFIIFYIHQLLV